MENEIEPVMRGTLPFLSLALVLSLCILISPASVSATQDIPAYRVLQYDLQSSHFGSRQSAFSADARSLDADLLLRKCVFSRLEEVNEEEIFNAIANETSAFIVLVPNLRFPSKANKEKIMQLERAIIRREVTIPTYLTEENTSTKELYEQIKSTTISLSDRSTSVLLKNAFFGTGYHIVVSGSQPKPLPDLVFHNIQARIRASVPAKNGPTPVVAFVAHYDAIGLAPALSFGTDSNGSGVIALLELARIFSSLKKKNDLTYNVMFLLTSGGKLNYLGVKKYLEERLDESDDSFQRSLAGAVCLDTIGRGDMMYLHVSKVPKDGSFGQIFLENLQNLTSSGKRKVSLKTKKINLSDDFLAWEHERFNIRRLSGLTLSSVESHLSAERSTISDVSIDYPALIENIKLIAEATSRQIFMGEVSLERLEGTESSLKKLSSILSTSPRSNEYLVGSKVSLVATIEDLLKKRSGNDVKTFQFKVDKKDKEVVLYDTHEVTMTVYETKPAAIDLIISILIAGYIFIVYTFIDKFGLVYKLLRVNNQSKESPSFLKKNR
ncbi:BOS complex subunit NCLN-like [Artemia franciscana]